MDRKTSARAFQNLILFSVFLSLKAVAFDLKIQIKESSEPLQTYRISEVDPSILNPHRKRWVLKREVTPVGLEAYEEKGFFKVRVSHIDALGTILVRPPGPWYPQQVPCDLQKPQEWFSTLEGAQIAAKEAAKEWEQLLVSSKASLEVLLSRISYRDEEEALKRARGSFYFWKKAVDVDWQKGIFENTLKAEWRYYRDHFGEISAKNTTCNPKSVAWRSLMEPLASSDDPNQIKARAPARRWDGAYSVRLTLDVAGHSLVGQFLIDPSEPDSIVSDAWLKRQGVSAIVIDLLRTYHQSLQKIGKADRLPIVQADRVMLSGYKINLSQFLIGKTNKYSAPKNITHCCDGILGMDFLRQYTVQFRPGFPAEVVVWDPKRFVPKTKGSWCEASLQNSKLVSECSVEGSASEDDKISCNWDLSSPSGVVIHEAPVSAYKKSNSVSFVCDGMLIAKDVVPTLKRSSSKKQKNRFVSLGQALLSRSEFVSDLPNGRAWLLNSESGLSQIANQTGIEFEFQDHQGDRVLRVKKIAMKNPFAKEIYDFGLRVGMEIIEIDHHTASDLDAWDIKELLSGRHGKSIVINWKMKEKNKVAPLRVFVP